MEGSGIMSRWGEGIFDSDTTLDFLAPIQAELIRRIVHHLSDESLVGEFGDGMAYSHGTNPVLAAVEIICLLCENANIHFFQPTSVVRRWREVCLERFESDPFWDDCVTPDGLDARVERRKVIQATFDRLEALTDED
jgi:hypothetical protein